MSFFEAMKAVILAGGLGTRLSEVTHSIPKPMVEIDGKPILWHIMKKFTLHGVNDFIVCLGYKGYAIKEYFLNYFYHNSDITISCRHGVSDIKVHSGPTEDWKVTLVDTGLASETAERLTKVSNFIDDQPFFFTYGDSLTDANLNKIIDCQLSTGSDISFLSVRPPGRFGALVLDDSLESLQSDSSQLIGFQEKPQEGSGWINGGYFFLKPQILDCITSEDKSWEIDFLPRIINTHKISVLKHNGFWHPMDTLRDNRYLNDLCKSNNPPWLT